MTLIPSDRIIFPSRVTATECLIGLTNIVGADNITQQDRDFAPALEEACAQSGIDLAFAYAHGANETSWYTDTDFTQGNNAFGIAHPDNASTGAAFSTPRACARAYVVELLLKLRRPVPASLADVQHDSPVRYAAIVGIVNGSLGTFPTIEFIRDLNKKFGTNNREAAWMTDATGPQSICAKGNRLFPDIPNQGAISVPTPTPAPSTRPIVGHVPKPPMVDSTYLSRQHWIGSGRDPDAPRAGKIVGTCHHTSEGYFAGNDQVLQSPSYGGLWDFQIGGPWDGANDGIIEQIIADDAPIVPWANGTVGQATAPFGDAPRFLAKFGIGGVNPFLRSIETTDGGQPNRDKGGAQIESLCFLTAWIHAEQAGQTAETFDWNMHHREFGVDHQQCPGAWIVQHVTEIQARVKAIMQAYQYGDPLNPPLQVTYPKNWKGPQVPMPPVITTPSRSKLVKRTPLPTPLVPSSTLAPLAVKRYTLTRDVLKQYASPRASDDNLYTTSKITAGKAITMNAAVAGEGSDGKPALFFASTAGTYLLASDVLGGK